METKPTENISHVAKPNWNLANPLQLLTSAPGRVRCFESPQFGYVHDTFDGRSPVWTNEIYKHLFRKTGVASYHLQKSIIKRITPVLVFWMSTANFSPPPLILLNSAPPLVYGTQRHSFQSSLIFYGERHRSQLWHIPRFSENHMWHHPLPCWQKWCPCHDLSSTNSTSFFVLLNFTIRTRWAQ